MKSKINFNKLQNVLGKLGYSADSSNTNRVVFRHAEIDLPIIMRRMRRNEILKPIDVLSVQNALANGGVVPKEQFDSLFEETPIALWHSIIDAEAEYENEHGHPPTLLKLPVLQAYDLAKLSRKEFGPLAERVMLEGIKVFEKEGLLKIPVELVHDEAEFVFE
jgi:hypothetical protein